MFYAGTKVSILHEPRKNYISVCVLDLRGWTKRLKSVTIRFLTTWSTFHYLILCLAVPRDCTNFSIFAKDWGLRSSHYSTFNRQALLEHNTRNCNLSCEKRSILICVLCSLVDNLIFVIEDNLWGVTDNRKTLSVAAIILLDLKLKVKCRDPCEWLRTVTEFHTSNVTPRLSWEGKQCKS